jgi:hypothetical protein
MGSFNKLPLPTPAVATPVAIAPVAPQPGAVGLDARSEGWNILGEYCPSMAGSISLLLLVLAF